MVVFSADKLILKETCFMETIPKKECNEVWTIYFFCLFFALFDEKLLYIIFNYLRFYIMPRVFFCILAFVFFF